MIIIGMSHSKFWHKHFRAVFFWSEFVYYETWCMSKFVCVCVQNVFVTRTVTHSALGGLISCRDFIDVVVVERNDEFLATVGARIRN